MCVSKRSAFLRIKQLAPAALLGLSLASAANAGVIQYQVNGTFDSGSLTGLHYSQTFRFDDASRPAVLGAVPWETDLLSFSMNVESMSKQWALEDWPAAHTFSQWIDASGYLNSVAYLATPGPEGEPPAFVRYYDDGAPTSRSNHVKWYDWPRWNSFATDSIDTNPDIRISAIPEPSAAAMLLAGLFGVILMRYRRDRHV